MRNVRFLSKKALLPIGLLGLSAAVGISYQVRAQIPAPSQPPQSATPAKVILEVIATHFGFEGSEQYLYLRVSSDLSSEAQYYSPTNKSNKPLLSKKLMRSEFDKIRTLLDRHEVGGLKTMYPPGPEVIDSGTSWDIKLARLERQQEIQVVEFAPHTARILRRPYPRALVKLGCVIEKLRVDVTREEFSQPGECTRIVTSIFGAASSSH